MPRQSVPRTLSLHELNRATLSRQLLLRRSRLGVVDAIDRLAPLQAQWPPSPYIALWSRLARFERADLSLAIEERRVVKATLMRVTLHLVSAREYRPYAAVAADAGIRWFQAVAESTGLRTEHINDELVEFTREARTLREIGDFVVARIGPTGHPSATVARYALWELLRSGRTLVNAAPNGLWDHYRGGHYVAADVWLGSARAPALRDAATHLLRRYFAAFGPASLADALSWSRARPALLREALAGLEPELVTFRDERGRTLYDLRSAPRPRDAEAPVRFLPKWDQLLLAYEPKTRDRVLPEHVRKATIAVNGDVMPTVLVDGTVAARWDAREAGRTAVLSIAPFGLLGSAARVAVVDEGERLVRFIYPGAATHQVRFTSADGIPRWNLSLKP